MGILGKVGSLYMAILIILLVLGFGFLGLWLIDYIIDSINNSSKNKTDTQKNNVKIK